MHTCIVYMATAAWPSPIPSILAVKAVRLPTVLPHQSPQSTSCDQTSLCLDMLNYWFAAAELDKEELDRGQLTKRKVI